MIIGGLGAGKTLLSTIFACTTQWPVIYSNYTIDSAKYQQFDLNQFLEGKYDQCLVLLDEAYVYLDARVSGRLLNRVLSYVLFQSRKMSMEIVVTTQLYSSLDNRFRHLADYVVKANRRTQGYLYEILHNESGVVKTFFLHELRAKAFYPRFDTMERVKPVESMNAVKRITTPPKQKFENAAEWAAKVRDSIQHEFGDNQKPTHDLVDFYCEALEVPGYLRNMVYVVANKEWKKEKEMGKKEK
jgi:hypothetical protein